MAQAPRSRSANVAWRMVRAEAHKWRYYIYAWFLVSLCVVLSSGIFDSRSNALEYMMWLVFVAQAILASWIGSILYRTVRASSTLQGMLVTPLPDRVYAGALMRFFLMHFSAVAVISVLAVGCRSYYWGNMDSTAWRDIHHLSYVWLVSALMYWSAIYGLRWVIIGLLVPTLSWCGSTVCSRLFYHVQHQWSQQVLRAYNPYAPDDQTLVQLKYKPFRDQMDRLEAYQNNIQLAGTVALIALTLFLITRCYLRYADFLRRRIA